MSSSISASPRTHTSPRTARVQEMAQLLRLLFEIEREFVRTLPTLIPRTGAPELKYLLCQHIWEAAGHARFLRERGRELPGFGTDENVRPEITAIFEEAIATPDADSALAGFYVVLKPALLEAYKHYLAATNHLADWPSSQLVTEFIGDEKRHAAEMHAELQHIPQSPHNAHHAHAAHLTHIAQLLAVRGGWLEQHDPAPLLSAFVWRHKTHPYRHPDTCNRAPYPVCSTAFSSDDPTQAPIVRSWFTDPSTDPHVIRIMIYIWLMMEMDAVDYLATVFYDTPHASFDLHYDLARHLWDESRHSQFGYRQLPRHGFDLATLEHSLDLYNILVRMLPHERYALMTMEFEAGSFPTKAIIMDRVRELNDFEADTLLAFDRNDEQHHVRYGHRWLPEMMRLFDETRPPADFVRATQEKFAEYANLHGNKTPHTLPPAKRLTAEKILKLVTANSATTSHP